MSGDLSVFSSPEMKELIQDMRDLFSQSRLAFLIGAGCSKVAGLPLMSELTERVLDHKKLSYESKTLLKKISESFEGAQSATIEDYMSELVDFQSIAERRAERGSTQLKVSVGGQDRDSADLRKALDEIKGAIVSEISDTEINIATHQQFVRAIHGSLQAGRELRTVDYFVLNYDTLIEDALGLEKVAYCDGFTGAATGWWEPSVFKSKGTAARVFKIHGSIDWCLLKDDSLPRRIRYGINTESQRDHVLIYPSATKYQETQRDPFAQMLNYMRKSLCPAEGREIILAVCGYSFGDSHINLEIENALYQSSGRLTVAAFVGSDEPEGKLGDWLVDNKICEQIRVYANRGLFHGEKHIKHKMDLPWWKFEILTRLLGGER